MSVAVIIPARLGSTRLPEKPLLKETGKYLIQHVVEKVSGSSRADRVIVATDSERIVAACREFGAEVVMTRADHESGTDRIAEVAAGLDEPWIINVQGDEPSLAADHVDRLIELLQSTDAPMATLAAPLAPADLNNPNRVKVVCRDDGRALYFSRSPIPHNRDGGDLPAGIGYLLHLGLYGYRREFLLKIPTMPPAPLELAERLEQLRVLAAGYDIAVALVAQAGAGIDTPEDYEAFVRHWRATHG